MNLLMSSSESRGQKLIGQFIDLFLAACEVLERPPRQEIFVGWGRQLPSLTAFSLPRSCEAYDLEG